MDGLRVSIGNSQIQSAQEMREGISSQLTNKSEEAGSSFADTLKSAVDTVDKLQKDADTKMQMLATGRSQNLHETMIAAEKADLALRLMVQVRNKVIDAYQEIMKMQV